MKNLFTICCVAALTFGLSSCSSDDSCAQSDWIGTYTLTGNDTCELDATTTITADATVTVIAGSSDDKVILAGTEATIDEDNCSLTALFITIKKDGDTLTSDFGEGCVFTYEKN